METKKNKKKYIIKLKMKLKSGWPHIDLFLKELGCTEEELKKKFAVSAHINGISLLKNGELELCYESAWSPINETIDEILNKYLPHKLNK